MSKAKARVGRTRTSNEFSLADFERLDADLSELDLSEFRRLIGSAWRSIGWPVCLFVCVPALPVDSPVCLHLCCLCYLRVCPLVCAPVCLTAYPFVCLPIGSLACFSCLPVLLPGRLSVWLFRLSIHLFVCLSAYLLANCALH